VDELQRNITGHLRRLAIDARPIVMPTPWNVGPVVAYLFPDEPVTLIDSGLESGRPFIEDALRDAGRQPTDVARVIVTHSHGDHVGGARWLQEVSRCDVVLHRSEAEILTSPDRRERITALFAPLGFDDRKLAEYATRTEAASARFTPIDGGEEFVTGAHTLRAEHHPGHTPGHLWAVETRSGAMFTGDYLLASSPTNPGMMADSTHPTGRAPLLVQYMDGLRELASRNPPALFTGHGPVITDAAELVSRRLMRIERRTRRVLEALASAGEPTAAELADRLYRGRARGSWDVMAELVGHLDVLIDRGHATTRLGEDGYWHFRAA
jgi:glyoxylase-like metal-dependent hydrolase (beta-lactamase superfamily II)